MKNSIVYFLKFLSIEFMSRFEPSEYATLNLTFGFNEKMAIHSP